MSVSQSHIQILSRNPVLLLIKYIIVISVRRKRLLKPVLVDTHCHLDMAPFDDDRAEVVKRAEDAGIKYLINAGSDRNGNIRGLELSNEYPPCICFRRNSSA